jgi:hypothetical protein
VTPAQIIYQRWLAVLAHADRSNNVTETRRVFGYLADPLLRVEERGRSLRRGRAHAQEPTQAPDARSHHPHPRRRGPVDPGRARTHHWSSPVCRSVRGSGLLHRQVYGAKAPGGPRIGEARAASPGRSPNQNAVCEWFQGTMLQECWRAAFHRRHFTSVHQLQAEGGAWLITYNRRRRNTATTCAGVRRTRSSTTTSETRQHDNHQPQ